MSISQPQADDWRRSEQRIPIDLGSVPFLGSRENGQPSFAYLLRDVSSSGVGVVVPLRDQMVPLAVDEMVNFHLPFQLNKRFYNQGVIRWCKMMPEAQVCGAHLERRVPLRYPIYVAFETGDIRFVLDEFGIPSLKNLIERILEDAFYLKKGIGIYFEHLAPYFARHSRLRVEKKPATGDDLVARIRRQIQENILALEGLRQTAIKRAGEPPFPNIADLESLRAAIALELNLNVLSERFSASTILPYLRSVRLLEHQLYTSFNTLVLLHLRTSGRRIVGSVV
ncbi:MAG TPA: PilZ domain-containing protein [Chthoniobacterales bacterium]|nr:PilZ domain-containing protein [Chthoniobacterales bacterium]